MKKVVVRPKVKAIKDFFFNLKYYFQNLTQCFPMPFSCTNCDKEFGANTKVKATSWLTINASGVLKSLQIISSCLMLTNIERNSTIVLCMLILTIFNK